MFHGYHTTSSFTTTASVLRHCGTDVPTAEPSSYYNKLPEWHNPTLFSDDELVAHSHLSHPPTSNVDRGLGFNFYDDQLWYVAFVLVPIPHWLTTESLLQVCGSRLSGICRPVYEWPLQRISVRLPAFDRRCTIHSDPRLGLPDGGPHDADAHRLSSHSQRDQRSYPPSTCRPKRSPNGVLPCSSQSVPVSAHLRAGCMAETRYLAMRRVIYYSGLDAILIAGTCAQRRRRRAAFLAANPNEEFSSHRSVEHPII